MNPYPHLVTIKKDSESHTLIFNKSTFPEFAQKKTIEGATKLLGETPSPQMVKIHEVIRSVEGLRESFFDYTWSLNRQGGEVDARHYSANMSELILTAFVKSVWERVTFSPVSVEEVSDLYREAFAEAKVCEESRVEMTPIPFKLTIRPTFATSWGRIDKEFPDLHEILVRHGFVSRMDSLALEGEFDVTFDVEFGPNTSIVVL